jgi:hypothetical protein
MKHRLGRWAARLGILVVAVELASFVAWRIAFGAWFGYGAAQAERALLARDGAGDPADVEADADPALGIPQRLAYEPLHPYVGFVNDPALNTPENVAAWRGLEVNELGFFGPLPRERDAGRVVVALTGGSVAMFLSALARDELAAALERHPENAGKEVVVVTLALQGFKQPQQLFALQYVLLQGLQIDWVVNLDGFNEVALPAIENVPAGTAAIYPRRWPLRVLATPDPVVRRAAGEAAYLEEVRRERARRYSGVLRASVLANLWWKLGDARHARRIGRAEERATAQVAREESFAARGPARAYADENALYDHLAEIWRESSLQMHRLCAANGIRYAHFLQPNQYVPDSKPMGSAEALRAFDADNRFRAPVLQGYPRLQAAGAELVATGVAFHDLTEVFATVDAELYVDTCCHFNAAGCALVAVAIAAEMR